ncbi:General odorant-binding protein 19d [Pseudolycoriella hygida]|uniref:General odorant-binding protein 19d n=1 Tax=Pseudolycoriella hygida TaxID=35572 RepID=A0A9Q0MT22_9DIPT|nr:General odorant-binding protein 19d [Pseudolycoriella hygida]
MKLFCTIFVLLLASLAVKGESSEEIDKLLFEQANICKVETGANDKEVNEFMDAIEPATKVAKCLTSCVMGKVGVLNENKLVPDKLTKLIDGSLKTKDGKLLKDLLKDITEECKAVTDAEKCEAGVKVINCLNVAAKKRGFDNIF